MEHDRFLLLQDGPSGHTAKQEDSYDSYAYMSYIIRMIYDMCNYNIYMPMIYRKHLGPSHLRSLAPLPAPSSRCPPASGRSAARTSAAPRAACIAPPAATSRAPCGRSRSARGTSSRPSRCRRSCSSPA